MRNRFRVFIVLSFFPLVLSFDIYLRCNSTSCLSKEDKCFLKGNDFTLNCGLQTFKGRRLAASDLSPANWSLTSAVLTISNRSWWKAFDFKQQTNDLLLWHLSIPKLNITADDSSWLSKQQWILSVNVTGNGKHYTRRMSLLDITTEPILQWSFGTDLAANVVPFGIKEWLLSVSPCASDVVMAATNMSPGQVAIKLTYGAFFDGTTYSFMMDLCQYTESCTETMLLDLVLVNRYVLLVTSSGLLISNNLETPLEGSRDHRKQNISWSFVNKSFDCTRLSDARLKYTKNCYSEALHSPVVDIVHVVFSCLTRTKQVFVSQEPFLQWNPVYVTNPPEVQSILDIAHDVHINTSIILYRRKDDTVTIQIRDGVASGSSRPKFKGYNFFKGYDLLHVAIDPVSDVLFVFGQQIMHSFDGGNSFRELHSLPSGRVAHSLIFDDHGKKYLVRCSDDYLMYGLIGTKRLINVYKHDARTTTIIDFLGNVLSVNISAPSGIHTLDVETAVKSWRETFFEVFVPIQTSLTTAVVYQYGDPRSPATLSDSYTGRLMSYSGGGTFTIQRAWDVDNSSGFVAAVSVFIHEPFTMDASNSSLLDSSLEVQWHGFEVHLKLTNASWSASDVGRCVLLPLMAGFLITAISSSAEATAVSPLDLTTNFTVPSTDWTLLAPTNGTAWEIREDKCSHEMTSDLRHSVTELDVDEEVALTFEGRASARSSAARSSLLEISLSDSRLVELRHHHSSRPAPNIWRTGITLSKSSTEQGMLCVRLTADMASLQCPRAAIIHTVYLVCPCHKRLVYIKPKPVPLSEYLHGDPSDSKGAILFDLPKNYRPPSRFGIGAPLSDNIYNADPAVPRRRERYTISQTSGKYKQCLNKTSREECGCTPEMMYSDDAQVSDCKQRVYRLLHPGILHPKFVIRNAKEENDFPKRDLFLVHIQEINGRLVDVDCLFKSPLIDAVVNDPQLNIRNCCTPDGNRIIMPGAGLYHFRATVLPGYSLCHLYVEFQVYVDEAGLQYPIQNLIKCITSLLLSGAVFLYLWYTAQRHRPQRQVHNPES